jgi:hypothetical protein
LLLEQKQQEIQVINFPALHNNCTNNTLFQEFVPFVGMSDTTTAAAAPAASAGTAATLPAPTSSVAPGQSVMPNPDPKAEGLLRQVDSMNSKLEETQAREQALAAKNREMEARLLRHAKAYADKAAPMYEEWIKGFEANLAAEGRPPLNEATKAQYRQAFIDPDLEDRRAELWANHQQTVKLAASRKVMEERLKEQEAEAARLKDEVAKANQKLGSGLRSGYVETIAASAASGGANDTEETVGVTASGRARGPGGSSRALSAGEILVNAPSVGELPFLKKEGISGGFSVTASNASTGEPEYRAMRASVMAAPPHALLHDPETKDLNFPSSMRYSHPAIFGWLMNESGLLHADVSHLTNVMDSKVFPNIEQRVDTMLGGNTVGLSVPK